MSNPKEEFIALLKGTNRKGVDNLINVVHSFVGVQHKI